MKNNLEWYPRRSDAHRHPKFKLLRTLYGGSDKGLAYEQRFWSLNDLIADSDGCVLDLTLMRNKAVVAEELLLSLDELDNFINRLLSSDVELLKEVKPGCYTTEIIQESLNQANMERKRKRERKEKGKSSPEKDESSPEKSKSSPENNDTRQDMTEHNKIGEDTALVLFFNTFGREPNPVELEAVKDVIKAHGYDKAYDAFKKGVYDGCKKIKTLKERISESGEYTPFSETDKSRASPAYYTYDELLAMAGKSKLQGASMERFLDKYEVCKKMGENNKPLWQLKNNNN
jgi:hypothetical protein